MGQWEEWSPWTENMIDDDMTEKLVKIGTRNKFAKEDVFYWEGLDNRLFLLLNGIVEVSITTVSGRKRILAIREARTFLDDALIQGFYYAVTMTCLTPVEVVVFEHEVLRKAGYEDPSILECMLKSTIQKIQGLSLQLAEQTFDEVDYRVYLLLSNLAKKYGVPMGDGYCIEKPLTHQLIADVVGSTRVRVTQILKELTCQGLLSKMGKKYIVYTDKNRIPENTETPKNH